MPDSGFQVEHAGAVAVLTLDRPPVNAIGACGYRALAQTLAELDTDAATRVIVVTGTGERAFCAGTDVAEFNDGERLGELTAAALAFYGMLSGLRTPLVGALNGPAVGGGAMIAAECDVLVAVQRAWLGVPELQLGFPGGGSHLGRLVPRPIALRMLLLGERVDAARLLELGVLCAVTPDVVTLREAALRCAHTIAALAPEAVAGARAALRRDADAHALAGYREELALLQQIVQRREKAG